MNPHDVEPEPVLRNLIAALALALGAAACQDKPPEMSSARVDSEPVAERPAGTAGAVPGTAEDRMARDGTMAKSAAADSALATRVQAALGQDPALQALAVDVSASGSAITLVGTADNAANRDKASQIALNVQGVNSVENRIVIVHGS